MRRLKILGIKYNLPQKTEIFGDQTRYRISGQETQMSLAVGAIKKVFASTNLSISDIDLIISCCAVPYQLIPNMSSLVYEQFDDFRGIPCIDINTTCTSYISALDIVSYFLDANRYNKVLIIASDVPSKALDKLSKETYELFSDCAVATIVEATNEDKGVIYSLQKTFPKGAHDTEILGGAAGLTVHELCDENRRKYFFRMNGINAIKLILQELPAVYKEMCNNCNDIDYVVPHQASRILDIVMKRSNIKKPYINIVKNYGNMVSASIPFALKKALDERKISNGENVLLIGTAAGLIINGLVLKL